MYLQKGQTVLRIFIGKIVTTSEEAWQAYLEIKVPVAVKPRDGNQGKGVAVNIDNREQIDIAFKAASAISSEVIVERYMPGHDHRLLIIGGQLVAAARAGHGWRRTRVGAALRHR
ncbi:MAG: hypothetical protein JHC82_10605, partial [Stenotrophomonas sp.]|nr:hypothetical protein [Stenotrophomonas sp.]